MDRGISKGSIGVILATSALAAAITASQTHKIEKKIGEKVIITLFPIIISICIWGVALSKYYCIFFIVINTIDSIVFVAVGDYINKLIPSEKRATILSMASMIFSLYMIVLFPIVGKIADEFSLQIAFQVLAMVATIMAAINIMVLRHKRKIDK
ncbi:hypothetical protein Ctaglu_40930 [Clostridium tagluense]|uniref:Major facilitator superfamily (MFS) profile domain-containing protein n=1 Tax=Clostridium tagluense TaxID=360422 RepID=A0A401USD6_9CLOT|nr:hypothetical protein Ctaglu_40930 [Clostridium tagluense]